MKYLLLTLALLASGSATAQVVSVGQSALCDFDSLYDAVVSIDRGDSLEIRLNGMSIESYDLPVTLLVVDRSIRFRGGYQRCGGVRDQADKALLRFDGVTGSVVQFSSFANAVPAIVRLDDLFITGGRSDKGGGIKISGDNDVRLDRTVVASNRADFGGGIHLLGNKGASLSLRDSSVSGNTSNQWGGGVYCENADILLASAQIDGNIAFTHGGGLFLDNCSVRDIPNVVNTITNNRVDKELDSPLASDFLDGATVTGGGVFAYRGTTITLDESSSVVHIANNVAFQLDRRHDAYGNGGGLRLKDSSTRVTLVNAHIDGNLAERGGGVYISNGAVFSLSASDPYCTPGDQLACASMSNNRALGSDNGHFGCVSSASSTGGQGGAIFAGSGASILLNGVLVSGNDLTLTDGCVVNKIPEQPIGAAFYVGNNVSFDFLNSVLTDTRKSIDTGSNDAEVIRVLGQFTAVHSTISDNSNGFEAIFRAGSDAARIELANSILVESDDLYDTGDFSAGIRVDCSVISNIDQLVNPTGAAFISSDTLESSSPGFVNAGADDYRLVNAATAVDLCSNEALTSRGVNGLLTTDLDGQPRPVIGNILTAGTSYDAGAYENQTGLQVAEIDLAAALSDSNFSYGLNQQVGYTVGLGNNSPEPASGVGLRINLDPQISVPVTIIASGSFWNCNQQGHTITCAALQAVAANSSYPSSIIVAFQGFAVPTIITSTAEVLPGNFFVDNNDSNNIAQVTTSIAISADVGVDAVQVPTSIAPAGTGNFTFGFENFGPDVASDVSFRVKLANGGSNLSFGALPAGWGCSTSVDTSDGFKPLLRCTRIGSSFSVQRTEFAVSAQAPAGNPAPGATFDLEVLADTTSNDANPDNDYLLIQVPITIPDSNPEPPVDALFTDSFEG